MRTSTSEFQQRHRHAGRIREVAPLILLVALALVLGPCAASAQVLYGSLTGSVVDASQAAVPNANVVALNVGTGVSKQVTTSTQGAYLFSGLLPGVYKVTVSAAGFSKAVKDGVDIGANQVVRVDAALQVGQLTESIEVTTTAGVLQTDRADVNTQLESTQLANLPITSSAGRNFQSLYKLVPGFGMITEGVSSDGGNPQRTMAGNVNGGSQQNNLTRIDGTSNTYMWLPFNTAYVPPTESIESVSIVTNSYDAEQGNSNGAAVNVVTKTGTNEFHGSGFEYHTDNALKALNRFQAVGIRKSKYIMNQYGGSIGGPIRKNKLFFFADWEGTKRRMLAQGTKTVINPDSIFDSAGNANLAAAIPAGTNCDVTRVAGCIFDPNTGKADGTGRSAFPGNIIPANRIDPAVKTILGRINKSGFINTDGVTASSNYVAIGPAKLDRNTIDTKINYLPSEKITIFGRYSISATTYFDPPVLGLAMGGATGGGQVGTAPSRIQNVGLGGTYTISPTMLVDVNAGYTRQRLGATYAPDLDLGNYGVNTLHIPGTNGDTYLTGGTPGFIGLNTWNAMGNSDTGNPFLFRDNQYVANINLSWTRGRHGLRFGMEHTRSGMNHYQPQGGAFGTPRGSFNFAGGVTALNGGPAVNKANSLAELLLGLPDRVGTVVQTSNPNSLRWKTWSGYARDSWQVNSKLTVNFGVRWEYYPFLTTDHGGAKLFDPSTGNVLICGSGSTPLDCGVDVGHGQFLPRLGIAYRLNEKTVIRTGYGMSADSNNWRFFRNNWPLVGNADVQGASSFYPAASLTGETLVPYPGLRVGIPAAVSPDTSSGVVPLPNNTGAGGGTVPFKFNRGYTHSYNLTLQREIGHAVAEAAYVGSRGIRMLTNENINAAPINGGNPGRRLFPVANKNWGDLNSLSPDAPMYYDALQTKVTWRLKGGSMIGMNYTFSKAINWDDNEEVSGTFGVNGGYLFWPYPDYRNRNKALASFDRTHNMSIYGVIELPFGPKKQWAKSGIAGAIVGGWQVNWLLTRISGNPITLGGGGTQVNAPGNTQTPDQWAPLSILGGIGPAPVVGASVSCAPTNMSCHYFDPTAFAAVPGSQIRFGTTGRNDIRGPGFFNWDASIFRDFRITERVKFQIRAEMFGLTNTPHYGNPGIDVTNTATFGVITSTLNLAGRGSGLGGERQTWLSARVSF
jgi:hypothetical protein